ncbi:amino acid racemase [Paenibacillus sp. M1]|uniref:Amino acid racemase n=1 Tax=Paenibacillus haidiansis TaxID=1574488 RepID=A0ABU7VPU9_9BACL
MKKLGIIGGLGPMASVYFLELIIKMTDVKRDQDHIRVYLYSIPDTPDRTDYICGKSDKNPLPFLVEAGISLERQGADYIAIPCVTAQYFYEELTKVLSIPVIPIIPSVVGEIKKMNIRTVGVLATNGTIESQLLQKEFNKMGIKVVVPSQNGQEVIMNIIYNQIKAGSQGDLVQFLRVGDELKKMGAEKIIIACTELSLLKRENFINNEYVDILEILAKNAVKYSGVALKNEYINVI